MHKQRNISRYIHTVQVGSDTRDARDGVRRTPVSTNAQRRTGRATQVRKSTKTSVYVGLMCGDTVVNTVPPRAAAGRSRSPQCGADS